MNLWNAILQTEIGLHVQTALNLMCESWFGVELQVLVDVVGQLDTCVDTNRTAILTWALEDEVNTCQCAQINMAVVFVVTPEEVAQVADIVWREGCPLVLTVNLLE